MDRITSSIGIKRVKEFDGYNNYHNDKVETVSSIRVFPDFKEYDFYKHPRFKWGMDRHKAICFSVFGNPVYLKLLYISLVSYYKWTDISKYTVIIFVDRHLYKDAKKIFYLPNIKVVKKTFPLCLKYNIVNQPEVKHMESICILDCDSFVWGEYDRSFFYRLFGNFHRGKESMWFAYSSKGNKVEIFDTMQEVLNFDKYYSFKFKKIFYRQQFDVNVDDFLYNYYPDQWFISCFFMTSPQLRHSSYWDRLTNVGLNYEWKCDETIFQIAAFKNDYSIKTLADIHSVVIQSGFEDWWKNKDDSKFYWLHPVTGENFTDSYSKKLHRFYKLILKTDFYL